ncbi:hypothetical protein FZ934_19860 (plasmid) [Rhizobium grahamii]|uniref:Uncharacterized protein n=1 Tax=Rhizobium grahamii TaxID=1120045 RepID=A0A5Q0CB16_9HYPH|nr:MULTISPECIES: hypothetical protein [Rhizobium]QFY62642.1 hypothetical protein FZ934_19860 [Rhizobium grahamii]QRM52618.1 hypothetical protein F3Y33_25800 [Rhizobium sp. BG6]
MDDAARLNVIALPKGEFMPAAYPSDMSTDDLGASDVIVTWENHDEIVELFRRANSVSVQISELWQIKKGGRLSQEDVDFLADLMSLQARLSKTLSQVI